MIKKIIGLSLKWKILAVILIIGILGGFGYVRFFKSSAPVTQYTTITASKGSLNVNVSASGSIEIGRISNLGFRVGGTIAQINVKVGDNIKAGQQVAKLDTTTLQSQVASSQSSLNQANNNLKNEYIKGTYTKYDIANLQESINTAQANLNIASTNMNNTILTSPLAGKVTAINNIVGDNVGSSNGSGGGQSNNGVMVIIDNSGVSHNLTFNTSGKLAEIDVSIGQTITSGQILAKLDATTQKNQVSQAQSSLNVARNNLQNKYTTGTYTQYDIANLQEGINNAQLKLNADQYSLSEATLTSPIDGVITNINNYVSDTVGASGDNSQATAAAQAAAVMTVTDSNSLRVTVAVGETDITKIKVGQIAQISLDALPNKTYVGHVQNIDTIGTVTSNVVSYNVKISLDKGGSDLKPSMTANATILTNNKDNVITVPNGAIKTINGQKTVQILQNNQPTTVTVTTGLSNDTDTEITSGVNEGDEVITATTSSNSSNGSTGAQGNIFSALSGSGAGGRGNGGGATRIGTGN